MAKKLDQNPLVDEEERNLRKELKEAASAGDTQQVLNLLDEGADIESTWGAFTPLGFAIYERKPETALALLERGADPNVISKDQHGETPLSIAGWVGCHQVIDALIEKGADPFHKTTKGETPRQRAIVNRREETVIAMLKAEADYLEKRNGRVKRAAVNRRHALKR